MFIYIHLCREQILSWKMILRLYHISRVHLFSFSLVCFWRVCVCISSRFSGALSRLLLHFKWLLTSQKGETRNSFRWRGARGNHTLPSGVDMWASHVPLQQNEHCNSLLFLRKRVNLAHVMFRGTFYLYMYIVLKDWMTIRGSMWGQNSKNISISYVGSLPQVNLFIISSQNFTKLREETIIRSSILFLSNMKISLHTFAILSWIKSVVCCCVLSLFSIR